MRYAFDIKLTGYEQVSVEANNLEEAEEKALERFWEIYKREPVTSLRWKETTTTRLGEE